MELAAAAAKLSVKAPAFTPRAAAPESCQSQRTEHASDAVFVFGGDECC